MTVFDNLPSDSEITPDPTKGTFDPNSATYPDQSAGGKAQNKFKADLSGPSGVQQGGSFEDSSAESKAFFMPTPAPGNGSGALTDNNGTGNSSGLPEAKAIEPMLSGDPNNTAVDMDDAGVKG